MKKDYEKMSTFEISESVKIKNAFYNWYSSIPDEDWKVINPEKVFEAGYKAALRNSIK